LGTAIAASTIGLATIGNMFLGTNSWLATIPLWLGWIALTLYFLAKYATERAVICRLAYQELIGVPETVTVATERLQPLTWGFLRLAWLLGLYLCLIATICSIGALMLLFLVVAVLIYAFKISTPDPVTAVGVFLLVLGLSFLVMAIVLRYYAAWFVAELPLAIESTTAASFSIRRSRQLSATAIRRVVAIVTIAFLLILPINIIGNLPISVGQVMTNPILIPDRSTQLAGGFLVLVGVLLNILSELLIMPFWQTIKAIVYYDLRNRREGFDLNV
jgi:hypothetical protein